MRRVALLLICLTTCGSWSCGKKGPPRPPEPRGPLPPRVVEARQVGAGVEVAFHVPAPRGPKPSQEPVVAELVRVEYGPGLASPPDADAFRRRGNVVGIFTGSPLEAGASLEIADRTWNELAGGGVGWTLRYAIRVRDRRGRPSPLVVAEDLVTVEIPAPPDNLTGEPTADGIRLLWDPPAGEGPFRYNVYRGPDGGSFGSRPLNDQPLSSPEYLDGSVAMGKAYRYMVRTSAASELPFRESVSSPAAAVVAEDLFAPEAPRGLVAVQEGTAVRLFWDPNQERDLLGYRVYRRVGEGAWNPVGTAAIPEPLFLDTDVRVGDRITYRVTAADRASPANESPPSNAVTLDIARDVTGDEGGGSEP